MIIGFIPSRLKSTRLHEKPLIEIDGLPLIVHTMKRAMMSKKLDELYVCTDSKKIAAATIVGGDKNIVKIWDTQTGLHLNTLNHDYAVRSITFSKYNDAVYTGSSDLYVRYWILKSNAEKPEIILKHETNIP